jgi:uncharacterized glyoxalase superfamily protein PhnB
MTPAITSTVIQVFASDLARSVAFYRALGLDIPEPAPPHPEHVEAELPGGNTLSFDVDPTIAGMHPGWTPPETAGRLALAFRLSAAADVDAVFAAMTDAGYDGPLEPYDAPWGQRYATLADPDGIWVDLAAPLD